MNKTTVLRRLNTAQLILIALLLVGVGLAFWLVHTRSTADRRSLELASRTDDFNEGVQAFIERREVQFRGW